MIDSESLFIMLTVYTDLLYCHGSVIIQGEMAIRCTW